MAHIPVLFEETVKELNIVPDGTYVDMTIGGFGHGAAICKKLSENGMYVGFDLDEAAIERVKELASGFDCKVLFIHDNFHNFKERLTEIGISSVNGVLADLGVSSFQIDEAERGFSFMKDGPLDMRMDNSSGISAEDVVNTYSFEDLKRILQIYGEEKFAHSIASSIVKHRAQKPLKTTFDLVECVKRGVPPKVLHNGKNPAAKTFQAVRIEVNGELEGLRETLENAVDMLKPNGRLCVISFHSLEDRIVKQVMSEKSKGCICPKDLPVCVCGRTPQVKIITKNPICASDEEIKNNVRSRSAKLRVAEKI